jgi:hypothetical protein
VVELLALDLIGMGEHGVERALEPEHVDAVGVVLQRKIGPRLEHADFLHLLQHPQALQDGQVHRQQRFADMKAWVLAFFQQHHPPTVARQQGGGGGAGRPAADHQDIDGRRNRSRQRRGRWLLGAGPCACGVGWGHPG